MLPAAVALQRHAGVSPLDAGQVSRCMHALMHIVDSGFLEQGGGAGKLEGTLCWELPQKIWHKVIC
jgi:hypothetical protein